MSGVLPRHLIDNSLIEKLNLPIRFDLGLANAGAGYSVIMRKLKILRFISPSFAQIRDAGALLSAAGENR